MPSLYIRFSLPSSDERVRAPLLERLLRRAAVLPDEPDWRAAAFRVLAPATAQPAIGPMALRATRVTSLHPWVCLATPVHFIAGLRSVHLGTDGVLRLEPAEARSLADEFSDAFGGGGASLVAGDTGSLLCEFDRVLDVRTRDPAEVAGHDPWGFTPIGPDAARLKRLMSEIEMWLFEHAVNRARAARSLPAITGLWLWGGGATLATLPAVAGWTAGDDPLFAAFGSRATFPDADVSGVVVLDSAPGADDWPELEARWLAPALARLGSRRIEHLYLSAGRQRFSVNARASLRFWRRARPWWEWFRTEGQEADGNS